MKILEELWYGNINPNERDVKLGSRLHKLGALIVRHEETLMPLLSEQAKEIYEKLRDYHSELHGTNECEAFRTNSTGSSLGTTPWSRRRSTRRFRR